MTNDLTINRNTFYYFKSTQKKTSLTLYLTVFLSDDRIIEICVHFLVCIFMIY
jgi:hypothetical protein